MNKLTLFALLLFCSLSSFSQFHANLELGGSNFLGASITGEYRIALYPKVICYKKPRFYLAPKIGVGQVFAHEPALTTQAGFAIGMHPKRSYNSFELNSNISYLTKASIVPNDHDINALTSDQQSIYWCSGLDVKLKGDSKLIYTIGVGFLCAIDQYGPESNWMLSGDGIPMLKLGIGI